MDHIFSIHSSVHGHLVCVHILAAENDAAMNMEVCLLSECFLHIKTK